MVDILLASYNGEKYIEQQILSIIAQTYKDWKLLIHDDGSIDKTIEIIRKYEQIDSRIKLIDDKIVGLGCAKNFIHLLKYSTAPFVMFCDQDDVWFEQKVAKLFDAIVVKDNNIPQVVFSNSCLWNSDIGIISLKNTLTYPKTINELLFLNTGIQGASSIFNQKTKEILSTPLDSYAMHDHVLTLCAILLGEVDYVKQSLMFYRQHNTNITGNADGGFVVKIKRQLQMPQNPLLDLNHYKGVKAFYDEHKSKLKSNDKDYIETFLALPRKSLIQKIIIVIRKQFKLYDSTILLIIKILLRKFI